MKLLYQSSETLAAGQILISTHLYPDTANARPVPGYIRRT
jgi:hypothetical protein